MSLAGSLPALAQPSTALLQLIELAQASHPTVQSQVALTQAAQSGLAAARWQYFPTPSVSVQQSALQSGDPLYAGSRRITTAGLSQPLWTWGRLEAGVDKAQAQTAMMQAAQTESQQQIALRVTQAYSEWLSAHHKSAAYTSGLQLQQRLTEQVRRRIEEGQAAPSDQALADSRQASLRADQRQADIQARSAMQRLVTLVSQPLNEAQLSSSLAESWPLQDDLAQLLERLDSHAPSLMRLQAQVALMQANVRELQARLKPELQARLEWQSGNPSPDNTAWQRRAYVTVATQFGAGLSNQSAIGEALARQESAQADLQAQRLSLNEQVTADYLQIDGATARRADLIASLQATQDVAQSWSRQYLSGRKTWQDLMNAVREEVQLRAQIADFDATQLIASWRLALMTGLITAPAGSQAP